MAFPRKNVANCRGEATVCRPMWQAFLVAYDWNHGNWQVEGTRTLPDSLLYAVDPFTDRSVLATVQANESVGGAGRYFG